MHTFLAVDGCESVLLEELRRSIPGFHTPSGPGLIRSEFTLPSDSALAPLVFAKQWMPDAEECQAESVRLWSDRLVEAAVARLPEAQPWRLHITSQYAVREATPSGARAHFTRSRFRKGNGQESDPNASKAADAGQHRCTLIEEAFLETLQRKRRHLLKARVKDPSPFQATDSLVQLLLTSPTTGHLSVASAPGPHLHRRWMSPFPKGDIPIAVDKSAPSRAFAKLVESETRLGRQIQPGETCVDLGAAPGSWTYVALARGAKVTAIDRAPLREDLMSHPALTYLQGDAFSYEPRRPVDWLVCDVIAAPERCIQLVLDWTRQRWCRHFVVTIKFAGAADLDAIQSFKRTLGELCPGFFLQRLCANKNEACVFGSLADAKPRG